MTHGLVKIFFRLDPDDWHGHPSKSLWAEPVRSDTLTHAFQLKNSPFFARGVSLEDVVRAVHSSDGGLNFVDIIDHSGHSTYMLLVDPEDLCFLEYWNKLEKIGCTYECSMITIMLGKRKLYSVDIPDNSTDIYSAFNIIEDGERKGVWMFQEGHVGHRLRA